MVLVVASLVGWWEKVGVWFEFQSADVPHSSLVEVRLVYSRLQRNEEWNCFLQRNKPLSVTSSALCSGLGVWFVPSIFLSLRAFKIWIHYIQLTAGVRYSARGRSTFPLVSEFHKSVWNSFVFCGLSFSEETAKIGIWSQTLRRGFGGEFLLWEVGGLEII